LPGNRSLAGAAKGEGLIRRLADAHAFGAPVMTAPRQAAGQTSTHDPPATRSHTHPGRRGGPQTTVHGGGGPRKPGLHTHRNGPQTQRTVVTGVEIAEAAVATAGPATTACAGFASIPANSAIAAKPKTIFCLITACSLG
jgi:hypothetical protein